MMTSATALLAGIIAAGMTSPVIAASAENMMTIYSAIPQREDDTSPYTMRLSGKIWNDANEVPPGFSGCSAYFGGTTGATAGLGCISSSDTSGHMIGTDDFTIECWIKGDGAPTAAAVIMGNYYSWNLYVRWYFDVDYTNRAVRFVARTTASTTLVTTFIIGSANWATWWASWHHIAAERNGTNLTIYVDGVAGTTVTFASGVGVNTSTTMAMWLGAQAYQSGRIFTGWMDEFRITRGMVRYGGAFTPPGQFPRGVDDPYWANVGLLYGFDNDFGMLLSGTAGFRKENVNWVSRGTANSFNTITETGVENRSFANFNIPTNASMNVGSDDFTIELVGYRNATGTYHVVSPVTGTGTVLFAALGTGGRQTTFYIYDATGAVAYSYAHNQSNGNWYNYAIVRLGNTIRFYLNGNLVNTGTVSGPMQVFDTAGLNIGTTVSGQALRFKAGRFTRGARYKGASYVVQDALTWFNS